MVINGENIRKIHKKIYEMTIKTPKMYLFMEKVANKSYKTVNRRKTQDENALILLLLFNKSDYNGKIKKIINKTVTDTAEDSKREIIGNYIAASRDAGKWFYLASSHSDSALDHKPYQGKLYYDEKAPHDIVEYAKNHGYYSIQWVMNGPVWFITRPNCRHFFKSLNIDEIKYKNLVKKYNMYRMVGDRSLATPRKIAIEEYEDRLKLLRGLYAQHPMDDLRHKIDKTELLLKKWKNAV